MNNTTNSWEEKLTAWIKANRSHMGGIAGKHIPQLKDFRSERDYQEYRAGEEGNES
jgi:hypothetical protein